MDRNGMKTQFQIGETAYVVENNLYVAPVKVLRQDGDFYTVRFLEREGLLRSCAANLRGSRLFQTAVDAGKSIHVTPVFYVPETRHCVPRRSFRNPYGI